MTPISLNKFSSFVYGSRLLAEMFALNLHLTNYVYYLCILDIAKKTSFPIER